MLTIEKLEAKIRELATQYPNAKYLGVDGENLTHACFYDQGKVTDGPDT